MPSEKETPDTDPAHEIERDGSAPVQQTSGEGNSEVEFVHLPAFISDEFGISRSQARLEVLSGRVYVDDADYPVDVSMDIPRSDIAGKTVEVRGGSTRTFRFQIDATP
jgi:hypothetical protein